MLAYILAIAVAFGSFAFYMAAFFFPEVHRKYDFLWSGVGFFYAAVLWICAGRITGGVLLGQAASVALIGWLGWQTLTLRRTTSPAAAKTEVSPEVEEKAKKFPASVFSALLNRFRKPRTSSASPVESVATLVEEEESDIEAPSDAVSAEETVGETPETELSPTSSESDSQERGVESTPNDAETATEEGEIAPEPGAQPTPPNPPSVEMVEAARSEATDKSTAATPVEEFAPEVELAPFAEPPREDE